MAALQAGEKSVLHLFTIVFRHYSSLPWLYIWLNTFMQDSLSFIPASMPSYNVRCALCKWQGTPKGACHFAFLHQRGGLILAGCQGPTKSALLLPSSSGQRRGDAIRNMIKGSSSERQGETTHPLPSQAKQTGLEEMSWIYHQSNQSRTL